MQYSSNFICILRVLAQTSSMAIVGENISFIDQSASTITLTIKQNKNSVADLDSSKYPDVVQPKTECLNAFILNKALTHYDNVPHSTLIHSYSTTGYNKLMDTMAFEI